MQKIFISTFNTISPMTREDKTNTINQFFREIFTKGNSEYVDKLLHEDYNRFTTDLNTNTSQYIIKTEYRKPGREGFKQWLKETIQPSIENGIIEINFDIKNIVIDGDTAAVNYLVKWKQIKTTRDLTPISINKPVEFEFTGAHFINFKENKIISLMPVWETLTIALNLGAAMLDKEESGKFIEYISKLKEMGLISP